MSYESYAIVTFSVIFFAAEQGLTDAAEQGLTIHRNSEKGNWSKLEIRVVPKHFLQGNGCLKALWPRSPVLWLVRRSQTDLFKHTQKHIALAGWNSIAEPHWSSAHLELWLLIRAWPFTGHLKWRVQIIEANDLGSLAVGNIPTSIHLVEHENWITLGSDVCQLLRQQKQCTQNHLGHFVTLPTNLLFQIFGAMSTP